MGITKPTIVFITNCFSPAVKILHSCRQLELLGIVYFQQPGLPDQQLLDYMWDHRIPHYHNFCGFASSNCKRPDFFAVYSLHKILTKEEIDIPGIASLNLHPSLLPLYKGCDPWRAQFEDHIKVSGFTVHKITSEIDGGEIISQKTFEIDYSLSIEAIINDSVKDVGGPLLRDTLINYNPTNQQKE